MFVINQSPNSVLNRFRILADLNATENSGLGSVRIIILGQRKMHKQCKFVDDTLVAGFESRGRLDKL